MVAHSHLVGFWCSKNEAIYREALDRLLHPPKWWTRQPKSNKAYSNEIELFPGHASLIELRTINILWAANAIGLAGRTTLGPSHEWNTNCSWPPHPRIQTAYPGGTRSRSPWAQQQRVIDSKRLALAKVVESNQSLLLMTWCDYWAVIAWRSARVKPPMLD